MIFLSKAAAVARILFPEPRALVLCQVCELREAACICCEGERRRFSRAYGEG